MTTHSFTRFVKTMEGQYQVSLGRSLAEESSEDNVSRMLPKRDPIIILNKKEVGEYNPNVENQTLSMICKYVQCPSTASNCSSTVRPFGHCCDVCAGILTFASDRLNVRGISNVVAEVVKENNLDGLVQYSVDRIDEEDDDELIPRYQVAVFQEGKYDDTISRIFIMKINQKFKTMRTNGMEYLNVEFDWSLLDHSYTLASKIAGLVTFCILLLIALAVVMTSGEDRERYRSLFANTSESFRVVWHQRKEEDDLVQLVNPSMDFGDQEEDPASVLLLDVQPAPFQNDLPVTPDLNGSDGISSMEMKLIE